jgi:hypothetical protein
MAALQTCRRDAIARRSAGAAAVRIARTMIVPKRQTVRYLNFALLHGAAHCQCGKACEKRQAARGGEAHIGGYGLDFRKGVR